MDGVEDEVFAEQDETIHREVLAAERARTLADVMAFAKEKAKGFSHVDRAEWSAAMWWLIDSIDPKGSGDFEQWVQNKEGRRA